MLLIKKNSAERIFTPSLYPQFFSIINNNTTTIAKEKARTARVIQILNFLRPKTQTQNSEGPFKRTFNFKTRTLNLRVPRAVTRSEWSLKRQSCCVKRKTHEVFYYDYFLPGCPMAAPCCSVCDHEPWASALSCGAGPLNCLNRNHKS